MYREKRIVLICLPSNLDVFKESKISVAVPSLPLISLAQLSGAAKQAGYSPQVLDLSIKRKKSIKSRIIHTLKTIKPEYCGITFTTPLSKEADSVAEFIKKVDPNVKIIAGGVHTTIMPAEVLKSGNFDIAVIGEGEETLKELLSSKKLEKVKGLMFRNKLGKLIKTPPRELVKNLDNLPYPDYSTINVNDYHTPRINCKKNPVVGMETSRGCPFGCVYCNKTIFGRFFRHKSPKRVVDEMQYLLGLGFKEIHVLDDGFSTDVERAKEVCREILRRKLKVIWNIYNGMRANRIDKELLELLKKSGCYRISIGVESGNQRILDRIDKSTNLKELENAFRIAKEVGIETMAFCMIALPDEDEKTMQETIDFVLKIKPDIPKLSIMMPLPGTPIFEEWDQKGLIISKDWPDYIFHLPHKVYNHPNLKWETINKYYNLFYRKTMLNPSFILRRFVRDIKTGELFIDAYYFLKTLKWGW